MNNLRSVYLLIAVLFIWNLTLSVILNEKNTAVQDEVIVEKNVNGISTDLTKTVDKIKSALQSEGILDKVTIITS